MSILSNIQKELKAEKNQYNAFGKYKYRNAEDVLQALKPLLNKHQYSVVMKEDIEAYSERLFVKATVNLFDEKMQLIATTHSYAELPVSLKGMSSMQVTGATGSYAKKYALGSMFLLDDSKDSDSMDNSHQTKSVQMINDAQVKLINTLVTVKGVDREAVKKAYSVLSITELTAEQTQKLIAQLQSKPDKEDIPV